MINTTVLGGLNEQLKNAREQVARRDMALKLSTNREFKKLILEDFIVQDAARLVAESADPAMDPQQRADALSMAQAGGHLKRYLQLMCIMGNNAERDIEDIEAAIAAERSDGADDDDDSEDNITGVSGPEA